MIIYDNIHGYINIDNIAKSIIDTPVFQRLRNIHQTGLLYLVFPSAIHSRFEHSIGTYHLSLQFISTLAKKHPEINISNEIILLVSLAGLCHDLGHLIYSHLFDDWFLKKLPNYNDIKLQTKNVSHEYRSIYLLNHIIDRYNIDINKDQLKIISDLIDPKNAEYNKWKSQYQIGKWIFQIISNSVNSIDVDKFDYIIRDTKAVGLKLGFNFSRIINDAKIINDNICYSTQCSEDIYHMFFIRYRLHRQIYNHKAVKAIELLVVNLLFELEKEIKISEYILDYEKILLLTDSFIWYQLKNDNIIKIIQNINERKLPKLVYQNISINKINFDKLSNVLKETFDKNSYDILNYSVGYVSENSLNPLNNIIFYNIKNNKIILNNTEIQNQKLWINNNFTSAEIQDYFFTVHDFSLLLNQEHKEYVFRIYCTDLTKLNEFIYFFKNYQ